MVKKLRLKYQPNGENKMMRYIFLAIATLAVAFLIVLSGCATVRENVNCDNAAKVRKAAAETIIAIDRFCPVDLTSNVVVN